MRRFICTPEADSAVKCFHLMTTPITLQCPNCGGVLASNELQEMPVCPRCGVIEKTGDAHQENQKTPRDAFRHFAFAIKMYLALPRPLRALVSPIGYFFYALLNDLRPEAWKLDGEMPGSNLPISVCLYSTNVQTRSYISNLIFGPSCRSQYLGRTWVWKTHALSKAASGSGLLINEIDKPYLTLLRAGSGVVIPSWVCGQVDLTRWLKERKGKRNREVLRLIRQNSLQGEITHDQRHFDDFYDNMYVVYIKKRYGDTAFIVPRSRMQASFDKGELLLVKKNGEPISGQMITYKGSCASLTWLGVRDGKWEYVKQGTQVASYEFSFHRAEERGCRKLDLAKSRPFLRDGLLQFKRALKQNIVGVVPHKFLLRILSDSPATRAFLENTPFIFERFGKLHGAVFVKSDMPLTRELPRETYKEHFHAGLSQLVVFQFSPLTASADGGFAQNPTPDLSIINAMYPSDPLQFKLLSRAEWTELLCGIGSVAIGQAIAIYPNRGLA